MKGRKDNAPRMNAMPMARANGGKIPENTGGKAAVFASAKGGANIGTIGGEKSKPRADRACGGAAKRADGGRAPYSSAGGGGATASPYSSATGYKRGGSC